MFQNTKKRATRRGWPIMGYVGANGGGKSAAMVWDTIPSLLAGRPVLSTVRLLDFENPRECPGCDEVGHLQPVFGPVLVDTRDERDRIADMLLHLAELAGVEPDQIPDSAIPAFDRGTGMPLREVIGFRVHKVAHPLYVPLTDWQQLLDARGCDVLLDEVTGVASSRQSMSMPAPVANFLVQLRRVDVVVRWSAPNWARADVIIRECSQAVTVCKGYLPVTVQQSEPFIAAGEYAPEEDRAWRQRRLFKWQTYDAADLEDFTSGKRDSMSPWQTDLHWGPKSPALIAYDTYDSVSTVGAVSDSGRCYRCGGNRPVPKCTCGDKRTVPVTRIEREGRRRLELAE